MLKKTDVKSENQTHGATEATTADGWVTPAWKRDTTKIYLRHL